jgi:hypothetical protein
MSFQKTVITVAIVILIILLILIGMMLTKARNEIWPPLVGDCPDYWVDLSGNGEMCYNVHSLGKCNIPSENDKATMNFNQDPFTGDDGTCSKYNWANKCKVTWDGVTSGIQNPCDTTADDEEEDDEDEDN